VGNMVAQWGIWWLSGGSGGSVGDLVAQSEIHIYKLISGYCAAKCSYAVVGTFFSKLTVANFSSLPFFQN
jgi:hypothetical protein